MSTSDDERVKVGEVDDKKEGRAVIVVATESSVCGIVHRICQPRLFMLRSFDIVFRRASSLDIICIRLSDRDVVFSIFSFLFAKRSQQLLSDAMLIWNVLRIPFYEVPRRNVGHVRLNGKAVGSI